jgi:hypothetical protein
MFGRPWLRSYLNSRTEVEVEIEIKLRPKVSRPVCPNVGLPSGTYDHIFLLCLTNVGFLMLGTLSDERMGLKLTRIIASGPCQSSHSRIRVLQNSRPYFTVSFETPPPHLEVQGPGGVSPS